MTTASTAELVARTGRHTASSPWTYRWKASASKVQLEVLQGLVGTVERRLVEVVRDRHVRVVGKLSSCSSGPLRASAASSSHSEMPSVTTMNTTGDTGRKVAVPRSLMRKGGCRPETCRQMVLDRRHVAVDHGRRHQRDVGRDRCRLRITEGLPAAPGARPPMAPGWQSRHRWWSRQATLPPHVADATRARDPLGRGPRTRPRCRSQTAQSEAARHEPDAVVGAGKGRAATSRARSAPLASTVSSSTRSSSSSKVR